MTADLVLLADGVHTMTAGRPLGAVGVAIRDGHIVDVAPAESAMTRSARRVVRLPAGAWIVPGLVDAHSHPLMGLDVTDGVDLSSVDTPRALREALAATDPDERGWILGWGLDPAAIDGLRDPADLDDVSRGLPVYLRLFDVHSAFANAEALRRAGVDGARPLPAGSAIETRPDGRPSGMLHEFAAMRIVEDAIGAESPARTRRRLDALLRAMAASGLTGAHVMDAEGDPEALLADAESRGELPLRLRLSPWFGPGDDREALRRRLGRRGRRWSVEGVKLFLDGTIDNGTAWLSEPDVHGASTRSVWADPGAYARAVREFDAEGVPTATHAIGDAAVHHAAHVLSSGALRTWHRIEHLETTPDDILPLLAADRVAVSMQPTHCTAYVSADGSDNWSRRLGDRAELGWRTRDIVDAGAVLALGSDWPVAPFAPLPILAAARLRRPPGRPDRAPVNRGQALTPFEALRGYTTSPHASVGSLGGRLVPGAPADLTVLSVDPLHPDADVVAAADVLLTLVDGEIVHRSV